LSSQTTTTPANTPTTQGSRPAVPGSKMKTYMRTANHANRHAKVRRETLQTKASLGVSFLGRSFA
ncbi:MULTISPECIES: hypothetical protein, partial [Bifidobacterium]|uniref:hypothetical protein n=1 Tax=Bifidobacterium TaxID=1678 RepID=UPI0019535342